MCMKLALITLPFSVLNSPKVECKDIKIRIKEKGIDRILYFNYISVRWWRVKTSGWLAEGQRSLLIGSARVRQSAPAQSRRRTHSNAFKRILRVTLSTIRFTDHKDLPASVIVFAVTMSGGEYKNLIQLLERIILINNNLIISYILIFILWFI